MSVKAQGWVWDNSQTKGAAFTVMLCLAEAWSEQTGYVFMYVPTIARKCRITTRAVQKGLAAAVELGELAIDYEAGGPDGRAPQCSRYYLPFMAPEPGSEPAEWSTSNGPQGVNVVRGGVNVVQGGGEPRSPPPLIGMNRLLNRKRTSLSAVRSVTS